MVALGSIESLYSPLTELNIRSAIMKTKIVVTILAIVLMLVSAAFQSKAKAPVKEIVLPDIVITQ